MTKTDPLRPTDDDARALARSILETARMAALASLQADGTPLATRIGFVLSEQGHALSLVSDLAAHTSALRHSPACSLLLGEAEAKGNPLTHPRLSLQGRAVLIPHGDPAHKEMAAQYLRGHPKAKLYIGFADFSIVRFTISHGLLNAGFGKAYRLTPEDMGLAV